MADRQIRIVIVGDAKSAQKALGDTAKAAEQTEVKLTGLGKAFSGLGSSIASAVVGFAAVSKVVGFIGDSIDAASEAEATLAQLGAVLKSTGGVAGVSAKQATDLASALQGLTTYSDEAVLGGENLLLTFTNIGQDVFPQATETMLDMSTAMGQDVKSSALQLGKALQDPITGISALHDVGVNFTDQQVEQVKAMVAVGDTAGAQKLILAELNKEFGGSARAEAETYTGKMKQLGNTYGEIKEAIGSAALPALKDFTDALKQGAQSNEFQSFLGTLTHDIQALFSGHFFDEWALSGRKAIFLLASSFNDTLKSVSFGKLSIDGPLKAMRDGIIADEGKLQADLDRHVAQPVADTLSGKAPSSPITPAKVEGYGKDIVASYLKGLTSTQAAAFKQFNSQFEELFKGADGKTNTNAFEAATATLVVALRELTSTGQLTDDTMLDLSSRFGLQVPEVYALVEAYAKMTAGQDRAAKSAEGLKTAQQNVGAVQNDARVDLLAYTQAIADAQETATRHADEAAAATEREQKALAGLQSAASANADAFARQADAAQANLAAIQRRRQEEGEGLRAVLAGETEEFLAQLDAQDDLARKVVEKWDAEIAGQRRAKDAADAAVTKLSRAGNLDERDTLRKVQALRESGHAKEAAAEERALKKRQEARNKQGELARAEAAVAHDEFDAKADQLDKEAKKQDQAEDKQEKAAQQQLDNIKTAAAAQAAADQAAIAAQQRYIDQIGEAAKAQAARDKAAITGAQDLKTEREGYWKIEEAGATVALGFAQKIADANERTAAAAKETYDKTKDSVDLHNANPAAFAPPAPVPPPSATTATQPLGSTPNTAPDRGNGAAGAAPTPLGGQGGAFPDAPTKLPLLDGYAFDKPPTGYHSEWDASGYLWQVPDGFTLADYGRTRGSKPSSNAPQGGPDALGRAGAAPRSSLREAGAPATAGGGVVINQTIHFNGGDLGSAADQAAMAAQSAAASRRAWDELVRGGGGVVS